MSIPPTLLRSMAILYLYQKHSICYAGCPSVSTLTFHDQKIRKSIALFSATATSCGENHFAKGNCCRNVNNKIEKVWSRFNYINKIHNLSALNRRQMRTVSDSTWQKVSSLLKLPASYYYYKYLYYSAAITAVAEALCKAQIQLSAVIGDSTHSQVHYTTVNNLCKQYFPLRFHDLCCFSMTL